MNTSTFVVLSWTHSSNTITLVYSSLAVLKYFLLQTSSSDRLTENKYYFSLVGNYTIDCIICQLIALNKFFYI